MSIYSGLTSQDPDTLVRVFGPARIGKLDIAGLPRRAFLLIALLDLAPARAMSREVAATSLRPDLAAGPAAGDLRQLLRRVRSWEAESGISLIQSDRRMIWRDETTARTDLQAFLSIGSVEDDAAMAALAQLYAGDFLSGLDGVDDLGQWIKERRTDLRDRFVRLGLSGIRKVGADCAENVLQRLAAEAPYSDEVARSLLVWAARKSAPVTVRRLYENFARRLREDLGAEPQPDTTALLQELLPHDAGLPHLGSDETHAGPAVGLISVPRLLILPPENASFAAKRSDTMLGTALIDEVTHQLSRARTFAVFAPHTARQLRSRPFPDSMPYGADYIVSTRISPLDSENLRLTARLTKVATHEVMFSEELRFAPEDLSRRHADLVGALVHKLAGSIERAELRNYRATGAASAFVHYLLGVEHTRTLSLRTLRRARRHFRQAMVLSPHFVPPMSTMARSLCHEWVLLDRKEPDLIHDAIVLARRAVDEDPLDPSGYRELGHSLLYLSDFDEAIEQLEGALDRGPHHADVLTHYADGLVHVGRPHDARTAMGKALELNPLAPDNYYWIGATADFFDGDYAAAAVKLAAMERPESAARVVAAVEAMHGDLQRARRFRDLYLQEHPDFRVDDYSIPLRRPEDRQRYLEALRTAGFK
jgi:DNA-binding SARP family transcriptional activator/tetratricopeptide (TPR) repeat protein